MREQVQKKQEKNVEKTRRMIHFAMIGAPVLATAVMYVLTRSVSAAALIGIYAFVGVCVKGLQVDCQ